MYKKTPFHERTFSLCESLRYKQWAGYYTVNSYDGSFDREYHAFRQAVGVIDVTPLFKYRVEGKDAAKFLSYVMVKNIENLKEEQITYCCWCDDEGKVVDDGTVWKFSNEKFIVTAAQPSIRWFSQFSDDYDVEITEITDDLGALAVQGPYSRSAINEIVDFNMDDLKFFYLKECRVGDVNIIVTRTGYTGDLGYEIWIPKDKCLDVWDKLFEAGKRYGITACGMEAMDLTRVEAGFIMNDVDYYSAHHAIIERRKSTPYELGLGWCVNLKRGDFVGKKALEAEKKKGSKKSFVGLVIDWEEFEKTYLEYGLPPEPPHGAWRCGIPVYDQGYQQIGFATSGGWSPILKKNLALATIDSKFSKVGTKVLFEITVENERRVVPALVSETPFFNPERKRS